MAVRAVEENRIARGDLVEVPAGGKHWGLPESFDPAAARDPFARTLLTNTFLNFCQKLLKTVDAFQIQVHLAKADAGKMMMSVSHSRHHRLAIQIDDARSFANI